MQLYDILSSWIVRIDELKFQIVERIAVHRLKKFTFSSRMINQMLNVFAH